jgi:Phasin protein
MLSADENKPIGKAGPRNRKESRKAEHRNRKSGQKQRPEPDQLQDAGQQVSPPVTLADASPTDASTADAGPVVPVQTVPVSFQADPEPDQLQDAGQQISPPVTLDDASSIDASAADSSPVVAMETVPVSFQAIANVYGEYTRKSIEQTWSFLEKLAGVRSLDKALEAQTEYARSAYNTFVLESQKIAGLYSELAKQRVMRFEGFMAGITQTTLVLSATRN